MDVLEKCLQLCHENAYAKLNRKRTMEFIRVILNSNQAVLLSRMRISVAFTYVVVAITYINLYASKINIQSICTYICNGNTIVNVIKNGTHITEKKLKMPLHYQSVELY